MSKYPHSSKFKGDYRSPAQREFDTELGARLLEKRLWQQQRARERRARIKLGAPTATDLAELTRSPRIGRID